MFGKLEIVNLALLTNLHPSNVMNIILWLVLNGAIHTEIVWNSVSQKGICHRIPIQSLYLNFLTRALNTRQGGVENRDN